MKRIVDEMSSRERLTAYGRGEVVDRIPCVLAGGESLPSLYGFTVHDYMFSVESLSPRNCFSSAMNSFTSRNWR